MIADLNEDDEERSRIMGQIMGGIAAGVLIGYPLGGFLYDFIGESSPFILLVIVTGFIWGRYHNRLKCEKKNNLGKPDCLPQMLKSMFFKLFQI